MEQNSVPKRLKYNFVFMFARDSWWDVIFGEDLHNCPNVHIYKNAFNGNKLQDFLFRAHWSYSINSKINLPFKKFWFKKMYTQKFEQDLPLCFVYMGGNNLRFDGGFTDYVRRQSHLNKQVVYHADLISKKCQYDYNIVRNKVDMAITYDKSEAERYKINFFEELSFSKPVPDLNPPVFEYDVYFLGAVKNRYKEIMEVYDFLSKNNVKCKFVLAGVPTECQVVRDGIEYTKGISYKENLENIIKGRCVLELVQKGSSGITLRTREAVAYGRKLLTNKENPTVSFFSTGQLHNFSDIKEIDVAALREDYHPSEFTAKADVSPMQWLYYIQDELDKL